MACKRAVQHHWEVALTGVVGRLRQGEGFLGPGSWFPHAREAGSFTRQAPPASTPSFHHAFPFVASLALRSSPMCKTSYAFLDAILFNCSLLDLHPDASKGSMRLLRSAANIHTYIYTYQATLT